MARWHIKFVAFMWFLKLVDTLRFIRYSILSVKLITMQKFRDIKLLLFLKICAICFFFQTQNRRSIFLVELSTIETKRSCITDSRNSSDQSMFSHFIMSWRKHRERPVEQIYVATNTLRRIKFSYTSKHIHISTNSIVLMRVKFATIYYCILLWWSAWYIWWWFIRSILTLLTLVDNISKIYWINITCNCNLIEKLIIILLLILFQISLIC